MYVNLNAAHPISMALFLAALLIVGLPLAQAEDTAGQKGMHGGMQKHGGHHGGMQKGKHGKGHACGKHGAHGKGHGGMRHGKSHGGQHIFGDHWKKTLTAEQKVQLDRLHVEFAKKKHALKSGIHARKVQLAVMAVSDQPQPEAIESRINDLMVGMGQLMQAKYSYIAAQRKVLTPEQQVSFDMEVVHKADAGETKGSHGGGKH